MEKNIFLIGFMGSGKTRVGEILARKLGREFIDTDQLVEQKAGRSISEIFAQEGEESFRRVEHQCVLEASQSPGAVVSLGGGAVTRAENWEAISGGISIYLSVNPDTILHRVKQSNDRPLLSGLSEKAKLAKIKSMLSERERFYSKADIVIATSDEESPDEIAEIVLKRLNIV